MKKVIMLFACLGSMIEISGQTYERKIPYYISIQERINLYGKYEMGKDGLYHYLEYEHDMMCSPDDYEKLSKGNEHFYSYDKKNSRYYFYSNNVIGYYNPTKKADIRSLKKNISAYNVPSVTLEDIPQIKHNARIILDKIYNLKNDSIKEVRRIAMEKQREKEIKDSIEAMKRKAEKQEEYRNNHSWHNLCLDYAIKMNCKFCNLEHLERTFYVLSLSSDTIYYLQDVPNIKMLGRSLSTMHYAEINDVLKQNKTFKEYLEIWHDSLALHNDYTNDAAQMINLSTYLKFKSDIKKEAPYGFVENWGWNLNYADGVEPYFSFYNTSDKTIKYVDFYFTLYNAVGDKCYLRYNKSYTGNVRGVGPVEPNSLGSWEWERATHYTSADASEMKITKIVITYMDKTVKTLTGNAIKYE